MASHSTGSLGLIKKKKQGLSVTRFLAVTSSANVPFDPEFGQSSELGGTHALIKVILEVIMFRTKTGATVWSR